MNSEHWPLVSVVTPSYNMAAYLPVTIESILAQDYTPIEHIVIDGGSTDESISILDGYAPRLRYQVAPDKGPSDAAHRGFRQARGEIFAWLNADDIYLPGAIRTAVQFLMRNPQVDVVYGEGYWIGEDGTIIRRYPTRPFDCGLLKRECFICQPASFIRAASYRNCELDPDINQSFDYDLWIRMTRKGYRFASIPEYLAGSRVHRGAKTIRERGDVFQATMRLLSRHYGYVPLSWIFGYTAFRLDGRDQFFEPMKPSLLKYLLSFPTGLRWNRRHAVRFLADWLSMPLRFIAKKIGLRIHQE